MRTGGNTRENTSLEHCVQKLKFSPTDCLQTITGDEFCKQYGPQTIEKAIEFIGRVVKVKFI